MPLQQTLGNVTTDAYGGGVAVVPTYVEDVFSTYLYTGNGSTQTITNGIDLAGKGGLVWIKNRTSAADNALFEMPPGVISTIAYRSSNSTSGIISTSPTTIVSTSSSVMGFGLNGSSTVLNASANNYTSWTFRKAPKFFDVVTYTGDGSAQNIAHSLGSVPGMIIIKATSAAGAWAVYHCGFNSTTGFSGIDLQGAQIAQYTPTISTVATSSTFNTGTISTYGGVTPTGNGTTYVAYVFAHDTSATGMIQCGAYTGTGAAGLTVPLGYEPQWVLIKNTTTDFRSWYLFDSMRGLCASSSTAEGALFPNLASVESTAAYGVNVSATGLVINGTSPSINESGSTYIYLAIRRPNKPPTLGTQVFQPVVYTGTDVNNRLVDTGIVTDMTMARIRTAASAGGFYVADRLRGNSSLGTTLTAVENTDDDSFMTPTFGVGNSFSAMNGFGVGNDVTRKLNGASTSQLAYAFRRAPTFFDEICYTGNDVTGRVLTHNLAALPQLVIIKSRTGTTTNWSTLYDFTGVGGAANGRMLLNTTDSNFGAGGITASSSTTYTVTTGQNVLGNTYVNWIFGNCPGVSKVSTYTGNATTQAIACGFTGGARFVLLKNTTNDGDWYVYDTARGMTTLTDPYLLTNSIGAEGATLGSVTTTTGGFTLNSAVLADINISGNVYLFLAIA